ncbi:nuclear condensin complex protein [Coprinopsis sp. MPI-PUGE-AT-0042]|nr:nuclear condensin complex protein [Coprinopsis sp. MPI-PUGE-AT-0042]
MRIEELIIEGFKSYPVRTQISGWDSSFNAITGLNGSGKSNILDAICFVLGITNMQTMRAQNQQDLIYKRGQAGITKASVTIVFDNSDISTSPESYQGCKQITVTRQIALPNNTKWLLNGHKAQQQQILNLFQSVQLNINNPNFVIMQGRITKVLNMRPQEILGMVEEAAGTRMFEDRKDKAFKAIQKKEKKVQDITNDLNHEIKPKLEKLRLEKKKYLEYTKAVNELEIIARKLKAWEWLEQEKRIKKAVKGIATKEKEKKERETAQQVALKEAKVAETQAATLAEKRDAEIQKGGKLKGLQQEVDKLDKILTKIKTQAELKAKDIKDEGEKTAELTAQIEECEARIEVKKKEVDKVKKDFERVREKNAELDAKILSDQALLSTLLTGLSGNNDSGGGYMGQISEAKSRLAQAKTEEEQVKMRLKMAQQELATLEDKKKASEREASDNQRKLTTMKKELDEWRNRLTKLNWNQEKEDALENQLKETRQNVRNLAELGQLTHKSQARERKRQGLGGRLNLDYTDPYPNFNRRAVKGFAAELMTLPEQQLQQMYNVVIEDENVGKALLDKGKLKKRVTFLPLTKIQGRAIDKDRLAAAKQVGGDKVRSAISLVVYEQDVARAIEFGDVYDPSGTMSGGSAPANNGMLIQIQQLVKVEKEFNDARAKAAGLEQEEGKVKPYRDAWKKLKSEIDLKEHELKLLVEQVTDMTVTQIASQVEEGKAAIAEFQEALQTAQEKQKTAQGEIKKLEKDMAEFDTNKDGKIDELKALIKKQKATLQKDAAAEQLQEELAKQKKEYAEALEGVDAVKQELAQVESQIQETEELYAVKEGQLKDELAKVSRFDSEIKDLEQVIKDKKKAAEDGRIGPSDGRKIGCGKSFGPVWNTIMTGLAEDKQRGERYDFAAEDMEQLSNRRKELQTTQSGMKKKINPKVMASIAGTEAREAELDKTKIEETIAELDRYKRDALQKTWDKVSKDFGDIFAELPWQYLKLQPPKAGLDGWSGSQGSLGSVWKQSLTELMVPNCSIVDHGFAPVQACTYVYPRRNRRRPRSVPTQHIGQLFRTRFKGSQFIVVSLKEGLFTNANVLFKAKFRDGTSVVERTAQRSSSSLYQDNRDDDEDDGRNRRRVSNATAIPTHAKATLSSWTPNVSQTLTILAKSAETTREDEGKGQRWQLAGHLINSGTLLVYGLELKLWAPLTYCVGDSPNGPTIVVWIWHALDMNPSPVWSWARPSTPLLDRHLAPYENDDLGYRERPRETRALSEDLTYSIFRSSDREQCFLGVKARILRQCRTSTFSPVHHHVVGISTSIDSLLCIHTEIYTRPRLALD